MSCRPSAYPQKSSTVEKVWMGRRELPQAVCLALAAGLSNQNVHECSSGCGWCCAGVLGSGSSDGISPSSISPSSLSSPLLPASDAAVSSAIVPSLCTPLDTPTKRGIPQRCSADAGGRNRKGSFGYLRGGEEARARVGRRRGTGSSRRGGGDVEKGGSFVRAREITAAKQQPAKRDRIPTVGSGQAMPHLRSHLQTFLFLLPRILPTSYYFYPRLPGGARQRGPLLPAWPPLCMPTPLSSAPPLLRLLLRSYLILAPIAISHCSGSGPFTRPTSGVISSCSFAPAPCSGCLSYSLL
ncbi:hypothetical protein Taro_019682 [Colocasia esculenta]|uniref:Uncharacterized protein n=1 Tax=Colocasia esculenta TaxID=4460 RepID=A0A843UUF3_COLES|nr:hypothetical protein [Colocasia esculenta]